MGLVNVTLTSTPNGVLPRRWASYVMMTYDTIISLKCTLESYLAENTHTVYTK